MSAREHATDAPKRRGRPRKSDAPDGALEDLAKDPAARRAYRGTKLDARSQIRTATAIAGALMMRLDAAYEAFVEACGAADGARTKAQKKAAAAAAEAKRLQLAELRRTVNVLAPLNAMLLKAGKVVHDADLDRMLRQVKITGTAHFDALVEGEGEDEEK